MANRYKDLSPTEAYNMLVARSLMVVLDFREFSSYQQTRIRGSVRIPLHELHETATKLSKETGYLIVTQNGAKSIDICDVLYGAGHSDLQYLQGGFEQWQRTRLPVEDGVPNNGCAFSKDDSGATIQQGRATEAQRASYNAEGYLVLQNFIPQELCESLRAACEELQEEGKQNEGDTLHFQLAPALNSVREVVRISDPIGLRKVFRDTATSRFIAEFVGSLIGNPNIKIHHTKIFIKAPRSDWTIEWHQDFSYFVHTNYDLLAVSIMLDDISEDSGGIRFIPRSHLAGPWHSAQASVQTGYEDYWKIDLGPQVGDTPWVAPEIQQGGLCIHHCCMVHGSGPNYTDKWRRAFIIQFVGGDNYQIGGRSDYAGWGEFVLGSDPHEVRMISNTFALPPPRSSQNKRGTFGS